MKAMLLAAGRGRRMGHLTAARPKPLLTVRGRPLIDWHLERLAASGIEAVVINLGYRGEQIRDYLGEQAYGLPIRYSWEGWPALETGGGIVQALPLLGASPFWVINADIWTDFPLPEGTLAPEDRAHLVLVDNPNHHPDGDFTLVAGRIGRPGPRFTFSGIGLYRPTLFEGPRGGAFPLAPLLAAAIAEGRVSGEYFGGVWVDVGTPERLEGLNRGGEGTEG